GERSAAEAEPARVGRPDAAEDAELAELVDRGGGEPVSAVSLNGGRNDLAFDELAHGQGHQAALLRLGVERRERAQPLAVPLEEIPRDDGPLDLVGPLADDHERRVTIEALRDAGHGAAATP